MSVIGLKLQFVMIIQYAEIVEIRREPMVYYVKQQ